WLREVLAEREGEGSSVPSSTYFSVSRFSTPRTGTQDRRSSIQLVAASGCPPRDDLFGAFRDTSSDVSLVTADVRGALPREKWVRSADVLTWHHPTGRRRVLADGR